MSARTFAFSAHEKLMISSLLEGIFELFFLHLEIGNQFLSNK